jgi:hypothetical protein
MLLFQCTFVNATQGARSHTIPQNSTELHSIPSEESCGENPRFLFRRLAPSLSGDNLFSIIIELNEERRGFISPVSIWIHPAIVGSLLQATALEAVLAGHAEPGERNPQAHLFGVDSLLTVVRLDLLVDGPGNTLDLRVFLEDGFPVGPVGCLFGVVRLTRLRP